MERAPREGWEAAIDASLAARLLRPAVRAGISDPAHGRMLAARLQRMPAPSLADDVARRYGSTALDGTRPPIVYATPPAPRTPATSAPWADTTARTGPSGVEVDAVRPIVRASERTTGPAFPPLRPALAGPAVQRATAPMLPVAIARRASAEARQPAAGAVSADVPLASASRIRAQAMGTEAEPSAETRPPPPIPSSPVVATAPTRLQRTLAADRANAVPASSPALPLVRVARPISGGGAVATSGGVRASTADARDPAGADAAGSDDGGDAARPASLGRTGAAAASAETVQRIPDPPAPPLPVASVAARGEAAASRSSSSAGTGPASATASAPADRIQSAEAPTSALPSLVQRVADPAAPPLPVANVAARGEALVAGSASSGTASEVPASIDAVQRVTDPPAPPLPVVSGAVRGEATAAKSASSGAATATPASIDAVQRVADPTAPPLPVVRMADGEGASAPRSASAGAAGATPASTVVVQRAMESAGPPRSAGEGAGEVPSIPRSAAVVVQRAAEAETLSIGRARPVVVAGAPGESRAIAGGAAPVQRFLGWGAELGRAAGRLLHAAPAVATVAAPAARGLRSATATPPPGAPPAELPTRTAPSARTAPAVNVARLADEVYELLVRRLERERKQRGW